MTAYEMRISDWSSDVCSSYLSALFGVYGFLALGFGFLLLRYIRPHLRLNDGLMKVGFWGLNAGLVLMEIGRASCREREWQYVSIWVVAESFKKKKERHKTHNEEPLILNSRVGHVNEYL